MQVYFLYSLLVLVLFLVFYLLWRLNRLERLLRHYKCKNQEGVGALSQTKNPFFLFLALFQLVYAVMDWYKNGIQPRNFYQSVLLIGLSVYLYLTQNDNS